MIDISGILDQFLTACAGLSPAWAAVVAVVVYILREKGYLKWPGGPKTPVLPPVLPPAPVSQPAPAVVAPFDPSGVIDFGDRRVRVGFAGRWFAGHLRERAAKNLVAQGLLPADKALAAVRRIDDETVVGMSIQSGAFGDGSILAALGRLIDMLSDPAFREKIEGIVQWIMKLALMIAPLLV
jgi:hypothetical protein